MLTLTLALAKIRLTIRLTLTLTFAKIRLTIRLTITLTFVMEIRIVEEIRLILCQQRIGNIKCLLKMESKGILHNEYFAQDHQA